MIVKFFSRGSGSCKATMDYLLGKENDREGARLLSGEPELTRQLSDSLDFKTRYTVGVLSFEEGNIPNEKKRAIMESFESSLLAGLEKDQYNMTWIEHTDKDRLELNFVIANQELTTGKRLQPYYDKVDRPLVENWKQVINHEYGLTDPHDPSKTQAIKALNSQNLPKDVRKVKEQIGQAIAQQIEQGNITNRKDVIDTLEQAGFEIARETDKSIRIKNPDGKRNIRLEGVIYENRQLDKQLAEDHRRASREYTATSGERYTTALNKLQRAIEVKQERNKESFGREYQAYQREQKHHTASTSLQVDDRGVNGRINRDNVNPTRGQSMAKHELERQEGRISRDYAEHRAIAPTSQGTSTSGANGGQGGNLHSKQEEQESGKLSEHGQTADTQNQIRLDHERLFNTLQRTSRRARTQSEQTTDTNRAIDRSQSSVERTERAIIGTNREIAGRKYQAEQREQHAQQVAETEKQAKMVSRSSGMER